MTSTKKRVRTLIIDRSKWGRHRMTADGTQEAAGGFLLRGENQRFSGKMCCLGFACLAYGVETSAITNTSMPWALEESSLKKLPRWLINGRDSDMRKLVSVNDDLASSDAIKEKKITAIFAKHGIKVKFIN